MLWTKTHKYLFNKNLVLFVCEQFETIKIYASSESWTHDPWFTRPVLCHWAIEADIGQLKLLKFLKNLQF